MNDLFERYHQSLGQTQFLPPPLLARWQSPQVERIVRHAATQVPFYRNRLEAVLTGGTFDPSAWEKLPTLTRQQAQAAGRDLWALTLPREAGKVSENETSGSTGVPLRYGWCDLASISTRMQMERFWDWHGIDRSRTFAEIRLLRQTFGRPPQRGWSFRCPDGMAAGLAVTTPMAAQVKWLRDLRPTYLLTFPTHAVALAQALGEDGPPAGIDAVITVGEVLTDAARDAIAAGFGGRRPARVLDTYGCQEAGKLALTCPHGRYHICAENVMLEIIDDDGRAVPPGAEGWVAITALHNFATPFIRYRLGDRAIAGDGTPCPCGCMLPTIQRILGRSRNMLVFPDGRRQWPGAYLALNLRPYVPFSQFQMVQVAVDRIELRYVPLPDAPPPDLPGLAAHVRATLHADIVVVPVPVDSIARSPGGKFEDFVSRIG